MVKNQCSEAEFIALFEEKGGAGAAKALGLNTRSVMKRRRRIELRQKKMIRTPHINPLQEHFAEIPEYPGRLHDKLKDGNLLLGTDAHYIPGIITDSHKAFVKLAKDIKPTIIVKNGDELDFSAISRFAPIGWETRPSIINEIEWARDRLQEVHDASKNSRFYWPLGNHDARFETRIATQLGEPYRGVFGLHLKDHFPGWRPCWSVWINNDTVVKHRVKTGITAARLNTVYAGKHIFTGHTHRMITFYYADYNGIRYGMECGTMANPYGQQFQDYMEDNPREWVQGFVLLTFHKGTLLPPEPIICPGNGTYQFRGKSYTI